MCGVVCELCTHIKKYVCKSCVFSNKIRKNWLFKAKRCVPHTWFWHFCPTILKFSSQNFIFVALLLKIVSKHVFCLNLGKICPGKIKKPWKSGVFALKITENKSCVQVLASYVKLHEKYVCNLCTHKKYMCVTCVLYLKTKTKKSTCVYVRYVWCAVLDSTLVCDSKQEKNQIETLYDTWCTKRTLNFYLFISK